MGTGGSSLPSSPLWLYIPLSWYTYVFNKSSSKINNYTRLSLDPIKGLFPHFSFGVAFNQKINNYIALSFFTKVKLIFISVFLLLKSVKIIDFLFLKRFSF